jgi:hypothetical protein
MQEYKKAYYIPLRQWVRYTVHDLAYALVVSREYPYGTYLHNELWSYRPPGLIDEPHLLAPLERLALGVPDEL